MQLPFLKEELYSATKSKKPSPVKISDYFNLPDEQINDSISYMSDKHKSQFMSVLNNFPITEILDVGFKVEGEDALIANSRVIVSIYIIVNTFFNKRNGITPTLKRSLSPHCPLHPSKHEARLWIIVSSPKYPNIHITSESNISLGESTLFVSFNTPKDPTQIPLLVEIHSDAYIDASARKSVVLTTVAGDPQQELSATRKKNIRRRNQVPSSDQQNDKERDSSSDASDDSDSEHSSEYSSEDL